MDILVQIIHIYATTLPFALPFIVVGLILFHKRENRIRDDRAKVYARLSGVSVKEAKKILYPW